MAIPLNIFEMNTSIATLSVQCSDENSLYLEGNRVKPQCFSCHVDDKNDDIPIRMSMGSTNDISPLLCFHFWEPVYYKFDDSDFPSDSREKRGHVVGIGESVRHAMTFKILTDDTLKVIH
jgi:hypothetical protein